MGGMLSVDLGGALGGGLRGGLSTGLGNLGGGVGGSIGMGGLGVGDGIGALNGGNLDGPSHPQSQQKQRFVWSPDLHHRFEVAVAELGIDQAKPQAIAQLMDVHGENAPTRQNIKSHLQKYRLHMCAYPLQDRLCP